MLLHRFTKHYVRKGINSNGGYHSMVKLWGNSVFFFVLFLGFTLMGLYCFHNHTKKNFFFKMESRSITYPNWSLVIFFNFCIPCPHKINKICTFKAIRNLKINSIPQIKTKCCFALKRNSSPPWKSLVAF